MHSPRVDPGGRQVQRGQGPRARGSPAHVVGGHDAQHLGGLDAYKVVGVLQQGFQALQAACGAEGPTGVLQAQTPADPEVDGCADVGVKSTRAPLFAGVGRPGGQPSASESLLGPLGARKAHPGDPVSTPAPPDFCACLLLVPPFLVLPRVQKTPFIWRDRKSSSHLVTSCCVPLKGLHRGTPDRAPRNPAFLWGTPWPHSPSR